MRGRPKTPWIGGMMLGLTLVSATELTAATFQSDFNSGTPAGMNLYGSALNYDHSTGGVGGSGVLKITDASGSQQSSAIIDDFDAGATIGGFDVTFQLFIGAGTGADGMSFVFGDFADNTWGEEGPGTMRGLTITFDEYNSGGTPAEAPAIDVKWNNVILFHRLVGTAGTTTPAQPIGSATTIRTQTTSGGAPVYWPVKIHVDPDGTLDLVYNSVVIFTNLPVFRPFYTDVDPPIYGPAYRFGFGGRTGGSADNHWIDDLKITTYLADATSGQPGLTLVSPQPVGLNAGAAGGVEVVFTNSTHSINPGSITMRYNNTVVTPAVTQTDGSTRVAYRGTGGVIPTGAGTVIVGYSTSSTPLFTNFFSFNFVVDPYTTIGTNVPVASVDTTQPGYTVKIYQMDSIRGPGNDQNQTIMAERQLARGYSDPTSGTPFPNTADLSAAEPDGSFVQSGVVNYNNAAPGAAGNFSVNSNPVREDQLFPGVPGSATAADANYVIEFDAFIELKAGGHRFGVNSDDGFRVSFGPGFDAPSGQIVGQFNGGRGSADTLFDMVVPVDGYYPVRLVYWQGGGGANLEFFWIDPATGAKVLVNDPDNLNAPRAYRASPVSRPSITRVLPVQNWIGAFPDQDVVIEFTDGALALDPSTVAVSINNVAQNLTPVKNGKISTLTRPGSLTSLLPSGLNTVRVVYGFNQSGTAVTYTNTYSFTVAPYYGTLQPGAKVTGVSDPGFRTFTDQIDKTGDSNQGNGGRVGGDANRMPWPEVHLAGGIINPTNGLRYPNLAAQSTPGSWENTVDWVNWAFNAELAQPTDVGWIRPASPALPFPGAQPEAPVPGLPGAGSSPATTATSQNYHGLENAVVEITTYLQLQRGTYVFGFNSDDGFIAMSGPDVHDTLGTLLGFFVGGRGSSATMVTPVGQNPPIFGPAYVTAGSTLFSVIVPEDGTYPVRILYWQGGTGINAEFFSVNRANGAYVLVGDTANGGVPAFRTYNGPARAYAKLSVSPNPWDYGVHQLAPGPIKAFGRTRANGNGSDILNFANSTYPTRPWADVPIGGLIANGTTDPNLALLLDGVPVTTTRSTNGTDVAITHKPQSLLAPGSSHTASLVYAGTTNSWPFTVQNYVTLNAADARPLSAASPENRGFRVKMTQIASIPSGYTQTSVARAEAQLAGIIGPNVAIPGTGPEGTYIYTNIINWNNNFQTNVSGVSRTPIGNFQPAGSYGAGTGWPFPYYDDEPMPGLPGTGRSNTDNAAAEVFAYLEFPSAGYYKLAVNSDDAFGMKIGLPGVTNGTVLASLDVGKGSSDVPVSFVVPQAGLYPVRLIYYNGGGGANLEFFSYDENGAKIPINDRNNAAAIKAYVALAENPAPNITSATVSGGSITIIWVNGGTLYSAPTVNGPWTTTGDSDGSFTEPALGDRFYRVQR